MKIHDNFRQVVIMMTSDLYGAIYDDIVNYEATEENRDKEFYYDTYRMIHDILDYHIYADKRNNTLTKYYYLNITEEESNDLTLNTYIEYIKTFDRENEYKVFEITEDDDEYFSGKMTLPPQVYTGTVMFGPWNDDNELCGRNEEPDDTECEDVNIKKTIEDDNNHKLQLYMTKINLVINMTILLILILMIS